MLRQLVDALREHRDLHLGRARIRFVAAVLLDQVLLGFLGGGHAVYYEAASGTAWNLDCFCAVPGLGAEPREPELVQLKVPFGAELVHYAIGPGSCAVPGVAAGLGALWEAHGRLPWTRL